MAGDVCTQHKEMVPSQDEMQSPRACLQAHPCFSNAGEKTKDMNSKESKTTHPNTRRMVIALLELHCYIYTLIFTDS
jgi:hypothetical protein